MDVQTRCMELFDCAHAEHDYDDAGWREQVGAACRAFADEWAVHVRGLEPQALTAERNVVVRFLVKLGDDLFYGGGESRAAICVFQLAIDVDPSSPEGFKGCLACHLQGSDRDPVAALPFAERLVELAPARRRDLEYVRQLVAELR